MKKFKFTKFVLLLSTGDTGGKQLEEAIELDEKLNSLYEKENGREIVEISIINKKLNRIFMNMGRQSFHKYQREREKALKIFKEKERKNLVKKFMKKVKIRKRRIWDE